MQCLAAKPIVNGIAKDLKGKAEVLRFDMLTKAGREVANRFDVKSAPTVVVLDASNDVVFRHSGLPSRKTVVSKVTAI